jgi:hypothetical protein
MEQIIDSLDTLRPTVERVVASPLPLPLDVV